MSRRRDRSEGKGRSRQRRSAGAGSRWPRWAALPALAGVALAIWLGTNPLTEAPGPTAATGELERLVPRVLAVWPHDPEAFTQGLLWAEGRVYESTGRYGRSDVRVWEAESGEILARRELPDHLFAEGLALVGERLVQLTWREEVALLYDRRTLEPVGQRRYAGEGWGLCFDGESLVMSDGSATLRFRDPETFGELRRIEVRLDNRPLRGLNELACVEGRVWANVFPRDELVRIDPRSGAVDAIVDASDLRRRLPEEARARSDVLNGVAYRPDSGTFLLTGKLWPRLFEVELVPEGAD